jgi:hypothetical protein
MKRRVISVIGGSSCTAEEAKTAEETGAEIACAGAVLITGGLGGIMEAASRGARENGGLVIGILPGADAADANAYVDVTIVTGMGDARNVIVAGSGDAVIAVGGALGTLSEISFALKRGARVVGLGTWEVDPARSGGATVIKAGSAREAVRLAMS